jgi:hypothetical protein
MNGYPESIVRHTGRCRRCFPQGFGIEHAITDHSQTARPLGDEHLTVGKERDTERMNEPSG